MMMSISFNEFNVFHIETICACCLCVPLITSCSQAPWLARDPSHILDYIRFYDYSEITT